MASQDHIGILTQPCEPVYGAGNKNIEVVLMCLPWLSAYQPVVVVRYNIYTVHPEMLTFHYS